MAVACVMERFHVLEDHIMVPSVVGTCSKIAMVSSLYGPWRSSAISFDIANARHAAERAWTRRMRELFYTSRRPSSDEPRRVKIKESESKHRECAHTA
jgi:hypothetical protein